MLGAYLSKKFLDAAIVRMKAVLEEARSSPEFSVVKFEESVRQHIQALSTWSGSMPVAGLRQTKEFAEAFFELDLFLRPMATQLTRGEALATTTLEKLISSNPNHIILLGQPGAGKTTSLKQISQANLSVVSDSGDFSFPLLLRLRELPTKGSATPIIDGIMSALGIGIRFSKRLDENESWRDRDALKRKLVVATLEELRAVLMLDGFDELPGGREAVLSDIRYLALTLVNSKMLVTSRSGDFVYNLDGTVQVEICPLSKGQIENFSNKWLKIPGEAERFLKELDMSPYADSAIKPLMLAHLCAIFERVKSIPEKPKTVYKKIVNLVLSEWDEERSIKRPSKYAGFEVDRKLEFLSHLAFVLTTERKKILFSEEELEWAYRAICQSYRLEISDAQGVVREIETHSGLLIQSGVGEFEFSHRSLQEYLTAEYVVRLPEIPDVQVLKEIPNELAISVAISSNPSSYLIALIQTRLNSGSLDPAFFRIFIQRLAIEKPDFSLGLDISWAAVLLFSKHCEALFPTLEKSDQVPEAFGLEISETFVRSHLNTAVRLTIFDFYTTLSTRQLTSELRVRELIQTDAARNSRRNRLSIQQPNRLFVSETLFDAL